jgi:hypothetical protein
MSLEIVAPMIAFACGCKAKFVAEGGGRWEIIFGCSAHTKLGANPIKVWTWTGLKSAVGQCNSRNKDGKCTGAVNDCCIRYCPGKIDGACRIGSNGEVLLYSDYDEKLKCKTVYCVQENIESDVVCTVDEEKDDKQVFILKKKGNQADWENNYTR